MQLRLFPKDPDNLCLLRKKILVDDVQVVVDVEWRVAVESWLISGRTSACQFCHIPLVVSYWNNIGDGHLRNF